MYQQDQIVSVKKDLVNDTFFPFLSVESESLTLLYKFNVMNSIYNLKPSKLAFIQVLPQSFFCAKMMITSLSLYCHLVQNS